MRSCCSGVKRSFWSIRCKNSRRTNQGFGRVLYHAPWIVGLGSAAGLVFLIRRVTRRPAREASTGGTVGAVDTPRAGAPVEDTVGGKAAEESYNERLDEELRALD